MKKLLIVVDYQNDFVNGTLGFDDAIELEKPIANRIKSAKDNGEEVVFTKDVHEDNYLMSEEGKNLPISHCIRNSGGEDFFGEIKELSKEHLVFEKNTFGSSLLFDYLKENHFDQITLIGLVSYICVLSNAVIAKAANPDAHIIIEKDLTSGIDKKLQNEAFDVLKNIHIQIK
ncbi:MAG TPA: N-carbamoylsarcosine amidohydrolase [Firmicutes bacterium]|nr:N-carbamoylsarcosine amidohydrolase [Bacillota bacterium]